ncbi:MAG TPA: hypothetical protein ENI23_01465 [bacterium]|nr:hypothetical protein [bacterium]
MGLSLGSANLQSRGLMQRQNMFRFRVPSFPSAVADSPDVLSFQCRQATVPRKGSTVIQKRFNNSFITYNGPIEFDGVFDVVFLLDQNWEIYKLLYKWFKLTGATPGTFGSAELSDFKKDAFIEPAKIDGTAGQRVIYKNCWVHELPEVALDQEGTEHVEITVNFACDDFYVTDGENFTEL